MAIFTMNGGNGTLAPSRALASYLRHTGCHVSVHDLMKEAHPPGDAFCSLYNRLLRADLSSASMYMEFAHWMRADRFEWFNLIGRKRTRNIIQAERPDAIVITSPWLTRMVRGAVSEAGGNGRKRPRLYVDVVDLGVEMPLSWIDCDVDFTFLPTGDAHTYLTGNGLEPGACGVLGLPLGEEFARGGVEAGERMRAREALGVERDAQVITILGGREGVHNTSEILGVVHRTFPEASILVQCGLNRRLARKCSRMFPHQERVRVLGYVDSMRALMSASDLVISKPGASSTSELIVSRVPFILDTWPVVMPQERGNVSFVRKHRFGAVAGRIHDIPGLAEDMLEGRSPCTRGSNGRGKVRRELYGTARIGDWIISSLEEA